MMIYIKKCAVSVGRKDSVIRICNADPGFQVTDGAHLWPYLGKCLTDILNVSFDFEKTYYNLFNGICLKVHR